MTYQEAEANIGKTILIQYRFKKIDFGKNVIVTNVLTGVIVELHRFYIVFQVLHSGHEIIIKPKDIQSIKSLI